MSLFKVVSKLKLLENMKDGSGEIHVDVKEIMSQGGEALNKGSELRQEVVEGEVKDVNNIIRGHRRECKNKDESENEDEDLLLHQFDEPDFMDCFDVESMGGLSQEALDFYISMKEENRERDIRNAR